MATRKQPKKTDSKKKKKEPKPKKATAKKTKKSKFNTAIMQDKVMLSEKEIRLMLDSYRTKVQKEIERREDIYNQVYLNKRVDQKVTVDHIPFTEEVAKRFLSVSALAGDRELHSRHLVDLKFSVEAAATLFILAYAVLPNGERIRLDGQHTVMLRLMFPEIFKGNMRVSVCEYPVENMQQAIDLWTRFNKTVSTRSPKDVFRAEISDTPQLKGLGIDTIERLVSVTGKHQWSPKKFNGMAAEQRKWLIKKNLDFFVFVRKLLNKCGRGDAIYRDKISKVPVLNVIYRGWKIDPQACENFWLAVINPMKHSQLGAKTCWNLHKKLDTVLVGGANQNSPYASSRFMAPDFLEALCSVCWNKWRAGNRATNLPKIPNRIVHDHRLNTDISFPIIEELI